jgi:ribonuclease-3
MGAVLLDGGFDAARAAVYRVFARALASAGPLSADKDPKTRLQEYLQHRRQALPRYNVVAVRGLSHAQEFEVECVIGAIRCTGRGSSRRRAEQEAARLAYDEVTRA